MAPPPLVTGLSPNEGPPGTKVTIRGENFGESPLDLLGLTICGSDCLLSAEWKSSKKIIAISGPAKEKGEIIITTRYGGVGTCNVTFKGYYETIGPMKESAVWVEETQTCFGWGRHSLSPGSYQQEDPLGLSVEGNDRKNLEYDLLSSFPNSSGNITQENFSPGWFLLENHHATSFNDLQAGLLHLLRKVEGQKEGQLSFLKANISSIVDQIDTIVVLKDKFLKDNTDFGSEPTLKLENAIKKSEHEARKLFDDVLTRRDRAEKTRNALNVLARFRFLFCLPCVIDRNIKKGDYDIVINDYMRVKNLFNKSDVPVFKMALSEIEKRVVGLQKMLHEKLMQMPITVEEQKRLIRHLVSLEAPYEPAWDAINSHSEYINLRMKQCYEEHKSMEMLEDAGKGKNSNSTGKFYKFNQSANDLSTVPENVLFIEELCEIVSELFPDLWKLGQSYFTGELHVKVESGRQVGFKHIVLSIMEVFCKTLRSAIIPHTLDKSTEKNAYGTWSTLDNDMVKPWLPACLRYVRSTYSILIKLDLPSEALDIVFTFILDLRIYCMSILFKQTADQIEQFGKHETWKIEFTGKQNGITELPIKFEQSVQEVIQIVRESVLMSEQREGSLLENPVAHKELDKQVDSLLSVFHKVLSNISSKKDNDEDDDCSPVVSQLIGSPTANYRTHKTHLLSWENRLLTTLANSQYTRTIVLTNLEDGFTKSGYPVPKQAFDNCRNKLEVLEKSVLELYLEEKSDPLVGTIEPSMYLEWFDWDTRVTPTDIRPYAKECINNLIHVHCEVNSISPCLIGSVLPQVVQTIAEELYRLMVCVQTFSTAGIQQAKADIRTLKDVFSVYSTEKAKYYFNEALAIIPALDNPSDSLIIEDIIIKSKDKMRLQILCLMQPITNGFTSKC